MDVLLATRRKNQGTPFFLSGPVGRAERVCACACVCVCVGVWCGKNEGAHMMNNTSTAPCCNIDIEDIE